MTETRGADNSTMWVIAGQCHVLDDGQWVSEAVVAKGDGFVELGGGVGDVSVWCHDGAYLKSAFR